MASLESRLTKLEDQTNGCATRLIWMNQGETSEDAWNRYLARPDINAAAITWARETGHILFISWADSKL